MHTIFVFTGSYFARDARYSSKFCHSTSKHNFILQKHGLAPAIFQSDPPYKCMFLARVLVGEYTLGHPQYSRPPSKDMSIANFFDSCVDDMMNPKIFVIFDSNQIYPEYIIEFCWCQRSKENQYKQLTAFHSEELTVPWSCGSYRAECCNSAEASYCKSAFGEKLWNI